MTDVGNEALDLLDVREVARRLHVSVTTVRRLIYSEELEGLKIGSRVLVAPEAVLAYKETLRAAGRKRHGDRSAA